MQITKTMWLSIALFCLTFKFFCRAQELPQGSYLQSCFECYLVGDALECETCLTSHGSGLFSRFENALDCSGDLSNNEGSLECLGQMVPRQDGGVAGNSAQQVDLKRVAHLQGAAQRLLDAITALENKGLADRALERIAPAWQESLEKLKMAAFGLRDQYAPIAAREQFHDFYGQFLVASKRFKQLVTQVTFQEYDLEAGSEASERVAQGAKAVVGFLATLDRGHFFKNIEKIQEIYDKEAKIIREKQLAQEEVARQQQQEHEVAPRDDWSPDENFFNGDYFTY